MTIADAVGFAEIRNDKSDFTATEVKDGATVPIDNQLGDNFTAYGKIKIRPEMTSPNSFKSTYRGSDIVVAVAADTDYGNGFKQYKGTTQLPAALALTYNYDSVYRNFNSQMQIGHVYGDATLSGNARARISDVYVQGNATSAADMAYMKDLAKYNVDNKINDGMVKYNGVATYIEQVHMKAGPRTMGPAVDGTSAFNVDFINNKLDGTLTFKPASYTYMPAGNQIKIAADISGSTFANQNEPGVIHTSGGFYGDDAQFLGGVYVNAIQRGGQGIEPGEGTTFQGTFGAQKQ